MNGHLGEMSRFKDVDEGDANQSYNKRKYASQMTNLHFENPFPWPRVSDESLISRNTRNNKMTNLRTSMGYERDMAAQCSLYDTTASMRKKKYFQAHLVLSSQE